MRGPIRSPEAVRARQRFRVSRSPPMSRTPVTPLMMNSAGVILSSSGIHSPKISWTCMSQRPGMRNLPDASTVVADWGTVVEDDLPSCAILRPATTTVMSGCGAEPVASMTVTWVKATDGFWAGDDGASAAKNKKREQMMIFELGMGPLGEAL